MVEVVSILLPDIWPQLWRVYYIYYCSYSTKDLISATKQIRLIANKTWHLFLPLENTRYTPGMLTAKGHSYFQNWLVVSTHLKNISQTGNLPPNRDENKKYLKPPPREVFFQQDLSPNKWGPDLPWFRTPTKQSHGVPTRNKTSVKARLGCGLNMTEILERSWISVRDFLNQLNQVHNMQKTNKIVSSVVLSILGGSWGFDHWWCTDYSESCFFCWRLIHWCPYTEKSRRKNLASQIQHGESAPRKPPPTMSTEKHLQ